MYEGVKSELNEFGSLGFCFCGPERKEKWPMVNIVGVGSSEGALNLREEATEVPNPVVAPEAKKLLPYFLFPFLPKEDRSQFPPSLTLLFKHLSPPQSCLFCNRKWGLSLTPRAQPTSHTPISHSIRALSFGGPTLNSNCPTPAQPSVK